MFWIMLLSCTTAALTFAVGVLSLAFSRAPGWRAYRTFSLICALICAYAVCNALFLHHGPAGTATDIAGRVSVGVGFGMVTLWLVFSRQHLEQELSSLDKLLICILLTSIPLMFVPGILIDGLKITEVAALGLRYHAPNVTLLGEAAYAMVFVTNGIVLARYARRATKEPSFRAWIQAGGFAFFLVFAFEGVLVSMDVVSLPYLGELGFLGLMVTVGIDMMGHITEDGRQLALMNAELKDRVASAYADVVQAQEALLSAERHAALSNVASGVGHEINDPLSYLGANLGFLLEQFAEVEGYDDEREALEEANIGVSRIAAVVRDLTVFADPKQVGVASVERAIEVAVQTVRPKAQGCVRFAVETQSGLVAALPEVRLTQILVHLFLNACHAVDAKQSAEVEPVFVVASLEESSILIRVTDTGCGMKDTSGVFDPFYTTRDVGNGTGMGLFVCREIMAMADGTIEIESVVEQGTTVRLRIPASIAGVPMPDPDPAECKEVSLAGARIYAIDDEEQVLRALRRILGRSQVDFVCEASSRAALEHLQGDVHYDAIICDLMMPELSGAALYRAVIAVRPELASCFLFVTGGAVTPATEAFLRESGIFHIGKPINKRRLNRELQRIVSGNANG